MNLLNKTLITFYSLGSISHLLISSYNGSVLQLIKYKDIEHRGGDVHFITPFTAFWYGFKMTFLLNIFDSIIWPIKLGTWICYLIYCHYNKIELY